MDDLEIIFGPEGLPDKQPFQVTDLSSAQWCAGKAIAAQQDIGLAKARKDELIARVEEWYKRETAESERTCERMGELLRPWVTDQLKGKKRRSVPLIGATVGLRKTPEKVDVKDFEAFKAWAKEHYPGAIRIKEEPDKPIINRIIKETGEVPDGVEIIDGTEVLYVKGGEE